MLLEEWRVEHQEWSMQLQAGIADGAVACCCCEAEDAAAGRRLWTTRYGCLEGDPLMWSGEHSS